MAEIIKTFPINLDLKRVTAQSTPISPLVVGDNGNIFEITLTDGGVPVNLTGCKVFAVFSRPDGQTVEQDTDGNGVTIGGENNNVLTIDVRTGSYSDGKNDCELQIYSGADYKTLVTSAQFNFDGRRGIVNDETVAAEERYPILVSLISQAEEASSVATSASATATQAAAQAASAVESANTVVSNAESMMSEVAAAEAVRDQKVDAVYSAYQNGELKGDKGDKGDPGDPGSVGSVAGKLVETGTNGALVAKRSIVVGTTAPEQVTGLNVGDIYIYVTDAGTDEVLNALLGV